MRWTTSAVRGVMVAWSIAMTMAVADAADAAEPPLAATAGLRPNLIGATQQALRYRPDGEDFVIHNGAEFFNRSLYGGNTAFRVDGGDKPEFVLYLPGRGGNLRLAIRTPSGARWLHEADSVTTRYRPGELRYEIRDKVLGTHGRLTIVALAYAATEGLVVRAEGSGLPAGAELVWVYGGVNGERGRRDGDIGTEAVPISAYFQFQPAFAQDNRLSLGDEGFTLDSKAAVIAGVVPAGARQGIVDGALWNDLPALLARAGALTDAGVGVRGGAGASASAASISATAGAPSIIVGRAALVNGQPALISVQRLPGGVAADELDQYKEVTSGTVTVAPKRVVALAGRYQRAQLPALFRRAQEHFTALRHTVVIDTPDPYLNAAAGALNVAADALWDDADQAIMHGAIAWRAKLLGWRGPHALDALGWHARARDNFSTWTGRQNTSPIPATLPPPELTTHLARSETALHSNGDLSHSHYDMNMVFIDALLRHLLWTGDLAYAREVWPVIERHLAWEQRLFRREFGPDKLPLYDAYATIWASDDVYYGGGGVACSSAYNLYANRSAARLATMLGKDGSAYAREADLIGKAMRAYLWMPERGAFAEYRDTLGQGLLHPSYGLWSFYHTVDSDVPTAQEAWRMATDLQRHLTPLPVHGPGVPADANYHVLPTTNWMPYSWSVNNVVMGENLHAALALWQTGRADEAYVLTKGALLASMYMGISPGNVGSMNYLDVYRRESQRDFGDGAGVMARALVEGLFGVRPDALARTLTIRPGLPAAWTHASLAHPDVSVTFRRSGAVERWTVTQAQNRFGTLALQLPLAPSRNRVARVTVNGATVAWRADRAAVGRPLLLVDAPFGKRAVVDITWAGTAAQAVGDGPQRSGDFSWLALADSTPSPAAVLPQADWSTVNQGATYDTINLTRHFNDSVTAIFKPHKYLTPRAPGVTLSLPSQGIGAWAGHVNELPVIDDSGLRAVSAGQGGKLAMPNGVPFATPSQAGVVNIAFTSQWDNYPRSVTIALTGAARHAYLLMAGSTNFMQSRIDNGEIIVTYADGGTARLALHNPTNWWPIEQDYFIDDYQFPRPGSMPPRVDLKTGQVRLQTSRSVPGGAATALDLPLDPLRPLASITVRTLANDVVIGLMSLTLDRAR
jgi:hypothetical protein